jgi:Flp pilus assembly protein TadG
MNAGSWMLLGATAAPSFVDSTVPSTSPHVYAVRAKGTGLAPTALSTPDVANVFNFSTNAATNATILATHLTDLRTLVNGLRANVGLPAVTFTDPTLGAGVPVRAAHITELRSALAAAFIVAGIATPAYTQPTLTPGTTRMKAADLLELRNALQ